MQAYENNLRLNASKCKEITFQSPRAKARKSQQLPPLCLNTWRDQSRAVAVRSGVYSRAQNRSKQEVDLGQVWDACWRVGGKYRKLTPAWHFRVYWWQYGVRIRSISFTSVQGYPALIWYSNASWQVGEFLNNSPSRNPWRKSLKFGTLVGCGYPQGKKFGGPVPFCGRCGGQNFNFPTSSPKIGSSNVKIL